jgi:alkylation response protein AidB-like acyl-CoA dehydrogenase
MTVGPTEEQRELAASEARWLERADPISTLRARGDEQGPTLTPAVLDHLSEAGIAALLTPEMGGSHADLAVLVEAHGYAASALPVADLAVGTWLLHRAGLPDAEAAASGQLLVGVARGPRLTSDGGRLRLCCESSPVPMAKHMDGFVVVGESDRGPYVALVRGADLRTMSTLDITRTWSRVRLDDVVASFVTAPADSYAQVRDALAVHRAFDSVGASARLLGMTVEYARQRHQFGAPIGSFQAVKHHCANMALAVEASRALCWAAVATFDGAETERTRLVSAAAAYAKKASSDVASTALQVHGGIGFTWEHDLHLLLRRIKVNEAFDGTVTGHRAALIAHQLQKSLAATGDRPL